MPPEGLEPLTFRTERVEYHQLNDTIVLDILEPPCVGLTVSVDAPADFEVTVAFGIPGAKPESRKGSVRTWEHPEVFLPGTHFRLTWKWKPAPVAPTPAGSTP